MMDFPKILVVEDEATVKGAVGRALSRENLSVRSVNDSREAFRHYLDHGAPEFDLVLLDTESPGMDSVTICQRLREKSPVPVMVLSPRDDETSIVLGLEVGADDYVTKPFSTPELVSRVRARLRRRRWRVLPTEQELLSFDGLEIDRRGYRAWVQGNPVELTPAQFNILVLLASHPGWVYSRKQIMEPVWGGEFSIASRAADAHIQNIRKLIEPDLQNPRYVQTVRGSGYRFNEG